MKHKIHRKKNHVSCNESSDNLQVQYMLYIINFADFYIASAWSPKSDCFQARKLLHCLSSQPLRRWCTYEWFYSAVDYPWFSNNEFVHYLDHAKLSHLSKLTRSEWSAIRRYKPANLGGHSLCFIVNSVSIVFVYAIYTEQIFPAAPLVNHGDFQIIFWLWKKKNLRIIVSKLEKSMLNSVMVYGILYLQT